MLLRLLAKLIGDGNEKRISALSDMVSKINSLEEGMKSLSDDELREQTAEFKKRLASGETLDDLLPEAFAAVREASIRTTGMRHFDVQLMGGIVLHQGKISEMKTGEGKTLVATLSIYLNALTGGGVHVITVNDYLAKRDSEWMGPIYKFLGLTVGIIQHDMDYPDRKAAYAADVTYGTNNEFGFDYLRDNMALSLDQCVQRELNYGIVDEVDSILIDEARTPLIISGMVEDTVDSYKRANTISRKLNKGADFTEEEKTKNVTLTEDGVKKVEGILGVEYLFDVAHMDIAHQILSSLKAWYMYQKDVDYVVKDGEVIIVDEFTGRLMVGRRYSDGLHQAIEAKETVEIQHESQTLATITFQNYFRMYKKLAGMTGTAMTEEAEFGKIYNLEVLSIPTHKNMVRSDGNDIIYKSKKEKFEAAANEIIDCYKRGQPVLVGTISIENSELLSEILVRRGIPHNVLNAKQHEKEAQIISQAGQPKAVTISTNMAGRGTDIVLGEGVPVAGGLHVIGTERHESRRIDNQLRGRSGRQGDPGSSRFYVSLQDELMRLFGSDRIAGIMDRLGIEEGTPIEHGMITRSIATAQKKVEQYHFSIRKQVLEYDDVMNKQREAIYGLRRRILEGKDLKGKIAEMAAKVAQDIINTYVPEKASESECDYDGLNTSLTNVFHFAFTFTSENKREEIEERVMQAFKYAYDQKEAEINPVHMRQLERVVMLRTIDAKWIDNLYNMDNLRDGIGLRAYGQRDPLMEYKMESFGLFNAMMQNVREEIVGLILKVQLVPMEEELAPVVKNVTYGAPTDGQKTVVNSKDKVGRNDPCTCGSGKKYKKCCGK
ncbi:MAG: preprotein translocase subunit SecA [bacterium]